MSRLNPFVIASNVLEAKLFCKILPWELSCCADFSVTVQTLEKTQYLNGYTGFPQPDLLSARLATSTFGL